MTMLVTAHPLKDPKQTTLDVCGQPTTIELDGAATVVFNPDVAGGTMVSHVPGQ